MVGILDIHVFFSLCVYVYMYTLSSAGVKQACSSFLEKQLDATNCLGIKVFAEQHSCTELLHAADTFCLKHYEELIRHDEFKMLPLDQVESLVKCDNLQVHV